MPDSVLDVIHRLSHARSQDEIMAVVGQAARSLLQADGVTLAVRERGQFSFSYAAEDAVSPLWKGRPLPMNGCIAGWCMTHGESVAIPDIYQDPRMRPEIYRPDFVRSLAMAPVGPDEPIAALGAYWTEPHSSRPEDLDRLQAIADGVGLAMIGLQHQSHHQSSEPDGATAPALPESAERSARYRVSLRPYVERFLHQGLRPNSAQAYAFAGMCVLVATLLQLGVGLVGGHSLTPYSFYYPAVAVALLVGGARSGVVAAALGGLSAYYFFMPPLFSFVRLTVSDVLNLLLYGGGCALMILIIDAYQRTVARLKHADALHLTLAREQQHRARNALAIVETIVRQSLRDDPVRARSISQRVRAGFAEVDIHLRNRPIRALKLLAQELEAFDLDRFKFNGDDGPPLAPEVSSILTLALHELAINALKYGALSVPQGRVTVACRTGGGRVAIRWRESGGPLVQPPKRRGFGSVMLHRLIEPAGGAVEVTFPASGVRAEISLPLAVTRRS